MYNTISINETFEPFVSEWGATCNPLYNEELQILELPLGWESELTERGIDFEVIQIEQTVNEI
jgi:hypothetical protein